MNDDERRSKWQDERIDDLAELTRANDRRLDALQNLVAAHDLQLIEVTRDTRSRDDHRFTVQIMLMTVLLTSIGTLAATIVQITHH